MPKIPGLSRKGSALAALLLVLAPLAFAQQKQDDLNAYYRYLCSAGMEYQSLTPITAFPSGGPFTISELAAGFRLPLPGHAVFQPSARAGWTRYDSQGLAESQQRWNHSDVFGLLGFSYSNRFAKYFELGAELQAGASESVFDRLLPDMEAPVGSPNLLFGALGRIALAPSYNFSIEIRPGLRYQAGLGELHDFDGFLFGIGFAAEYRFGQDPDAPAAQIRAIRFGKAELPQAFAAMQSWYAKNPIGKIAISNAERVVLRDIEVSFYQKGYMDSPTLSAKIDSLKPGESREVDLFALFNESVFAVEGVTPLSGEAVVSYRISNRAAEQRQSVGFDLYDKRAIIWDDDRKVAALITPDDGALKNYGGFIRQACNADAVSGLGDPVQLGMQAFSALGEIGCLYQANTQLPFAEVQGSRTIVDTVHLARETLKSKLGDCSDLTVLYCSLLESLAVETGFITVPGHIYAAVNTKVPAKDYRKLHPEKRMTLEVDGELWVPVEITLIGKSGFMDAWRTGAEEWAAYDKAPEGKFYAAKAAWETYRPVGLKETDLGLQYGRKEKIREAFLKDRDALIDLISGDYLSSAQKIGSKEDWNRAGAALARLSQHAKAEQALRKAAALDPKYASAQINLGNLYFSLRRYDEALASYKGAQKLLDKGPLSLILCINISRVYLRMDKSAEAKDYFSRALAIDPQKANEFAYLQQAGTAGARATDQSAGILYADE